MDEKWKRIFGHTWSDEKYEQMVYYLKYRTRNPEWTRWVYENIKHRADVGYTLNPQDETIILKYQGIPPWLFNQETNRSIINTTQSEYIFRVIPESDVNRVLSSLESQLLTTQLNAHSVFDFVLRNLYLGISRRRIQHYLNTHPNRQAFRMLKTIPSKPVPKSFRPEHPLEHWQMDLIDYDNASMKHANKHYKYILVLIDIFSKFMYMYPIKTKSAQEIGRHLLMLFQQGDIPKILHSDNAVEFLAQRPLCDQFGVRLITGRKYSPQTQGFVENKIKHIKNMIQLHFIKHNTFEYLSVLPQIMYSINNTKHSVTKFTPMQLHRGRDARQTVASHQGEIVDLTVNMPTTQTIRHHVRETDEYRRERNSLIKNTISLEANRREDKHIQHIDAFQYRNPINVDKHVYVAVYKKYSNRDIQPMILQLRQPNRNKSIENPLQVSNGYGQLRKVRTIARRKPSEFRKPELKRHKFYTKHVFKVEEVRTVASQKQPRYRLSYTDSGHEVWTVYQMIDNEVWTDDFFKEELILVDTLHAMNETQSSNEFNYFDQLWVILFLRMDFPDTNITYIVQNQEYMYTLVKKRKNDMYTVFDHRTKQNARVSLVYGKYGQMNTDGGWRIGWNQFDRAETEIKEKIKTHRYFTRWYQEEVSKLTIQGLVHAR